MAGKLTITVHPSGAGSDDLTVEDALHQILDFISLLDSAERAEGGEQIVWRLRSASTNSPFTVHAEATGHDPTISVGFQVRRAERAVRSTLDAFANGRVESDWLDDSSLKVAKRFFERNTNGIGRTDIQFEEDESPLIVVHANARRALNAIEQNQLDVAKSVTDWTHTEYGAVEGEVFAATQFYGRPGLIVRERLTGDRVTCILSAEGAEQIGPQHSWDEVWSGRRVLVNGTIHYNEAGQISRIDAETIEPFSHMPPDLATARKADITRGLTPVEFLSNIWGELNGES